MSNALRSSGPLSLAIMGSRVFGLARESVFAALFGAGAVADAYQVAFRVPNLLRDLFAEGALSSAFVPTFTAALHDGGKRQADGLANLVTTGLLLVTGALSCLGLVFVEPMVAAMAQGFGGDAAKLALSVELTRVMIPILALVSVAAVWMGMLNAQRRFVVPALAPALFNVVSIVTGAGIGWWDLAPERGILLWAVGTTVAAAVQAGMQLLVLVRDGYRPRLQLQGIGRDPGVRRILRLMGPATLGVAALNVSVFVNTGFASELGDGPVAQLSYAFRLFYLPLGVFGVALATVTTTSVSEQAARGDRSGLAERTGDGVRAAWVLTSASAVGLYTLAEPIVRLVFRWGATSHDDAAAVAIVLQAYVIGLVPYSLVKLLAPGFYGVGKAKVPLLASVLGVVVNVGFNAFTHRTLGAPGIALGTALGAFTNWTVLRILFRRNFGSLGGARPVRFGVALILGNVAMAALVSGAGLALQRLVETGMLSTRLADLLWVGTGMVLGFLCYAAILRGFGVPEAAQLWALPRRVFGRFGRR